MHTLAYDVLLDALTRTIPSSPSSASAQTANSYQLQGDNSYQLEDFEPQLLELLSGRLHDAGKAIVSDLAHVRSFLPDVEICPEPSDKAWFPSHCSNPACTRELFSVYVAMSQTALSTTPPPQGSGTGPRAIQEYQCFCTRCAHALQKDNQEARALRGSEEAVVLAPFQRYSAETVHSLVATIRSALKHAHRD
jgi:hypothetical protein